MIALGFPPTFSTAVIILAQLVISTLPTPAIAQPVRVEFELLFSHDLPELPGERTGPRSPEYCFDWLDSDRVVVSAGDKLVCFSVGERKSLWTKTFPASITQLHAFNGQLLLRFEYGVGLLITNEAGRKIASFTEPALEKLNENQSCERAIFLFAKQGLLIISPPLDPDSPATVRVIDDQQRKQIRSIEIPIHPAKARIDTTGQYLSLSELGQGMIVIDLKSGQPTFKHAIDRVGRSEWTVDSLYRLPPVYNASRKAIVGVEMPGWERGARLVFYNQNAERRWIREIETSVLEPDISDDHQLIAAIGRRLHLLDYDGVSIGSWETPAGRIRFGPRFAPDQQRRILLSAGNQLFVVGWKELTETELAKRVIDVHDLERIHQTLQQQFRFSEYAAEYRGLLGSPTRNADGLDRLAFSGWSIVDRQQVPLKEICVMLYRPHSNRPWPGVKYHFAYRTIDIGLRDNKQTIAELDSNQPPLTLQRLNQLLNKPKSAR